MKETLRGARRVCRQSHVPLLESLEPRVLLSAAVGLGRLVHHDVGGTPVTPPAAPTQLVALPKSWTAMQIGWQLGNSSDKVGVYRWDHSAWHLIAAPAAGATSYVDSGLQSGEQYYYEVAAFNAGGTTWASAYAGGQTVAFGITENAKLGQVFATSVQLYWNPDAFATEYLVGRWDGSQWAVIATLPNSATGYVDHNVQPNTSYYYEVVQGNQFGYGWFIAAGNGPAPYVTARTFDVGPPPAATDLAAQASYDVFRGEAHIGLTWVSHGDMTTVRVAKWDGSQWQTVANMAASDNVHQWYDASPVSGGNLYEVILVNDAGETWANQYAAIDFDPAQFPPIQPVLPL